MSDEQNVPQQMDSAELEFDSAFAEFAGEEVAPKPVEVEEPQEQEQTEQEPEPVAEEAPTQDEQPVDPLAGAPETVRKYVEELQRKAAEAEHAAKSQIGRVSALQKKVNELSSAKTETANQAAPQPGDEGWDKFKDDFPEIAGAIEKRIADLDAKVGQATQPIQEMQRNAYVQSQYAALQAAHPDWQDVAGSNEFRSWLSVQPPTIQALITSDDAADAAYLIGSYKALAPKKVPGEATAIKEQRKAQLQQATGVQSKATASPGVGGAPDDFDGAFAFFAKQAERSR